MPHYAQKKSYLQEIFIRLLLNIKKLFGYSLFAYNPINVSI